VIREESTQRVYMCHTSSWLTPMKESLEMQIFLDLCKYITYALCKGDYSLQWNWEVGPQFCYRTESNCVVLPFAASQLHYFQSIFYGLSIMLW
jgi:hypothetical protein